MKSTTSSAASAPSLPANWKQSFIDTFPVTGFWQTQRKTSNSFSRRRPRSATRIFCAAAAPRMSQSHGDKQKDRRSNERSKRRFDRRSLEMGWNFQTRNNDNPVTCKTCNGTGRVECSWCHATGVLMLGDRLLCSVEGHSHCLACDNGEVKCKKCKGTGMIASWMVLSDL